MPDDVVHVRYAAWSTLQKDAGEQLSRRGLFLREDLGLPQFARVVVKLRCPDGAEFDLRAEVVTVVPGQATAVQLLPDASDAAERLLLHAALQPIAGEIPPGDPMVVRLEDLLDDDDEDDDGLGADGGGDAPDGRAAEADASDEGADEPLPEFPDRASLQTQIEGMTIAEKRLAALHARKDMRMLLIRDHNKSIHPFVMKNPAITLDEIEQISKLTSVNPDVLHTIAHDKDWTRSSAVVRNLVRNPKTPVPDAVMLVDKLPISDLRAIVKSGSVKAPIQAAARKKVQSTPA